MSGTSEEHVKHVVIVTGGAIHPSVHPIIDQADMLIGADRGADYLLQHGYTPDLALGDFDSVEPDRSSYIEANSLRFIGVDAIDKNFTDTELAYKAAEEANAGRITILGATGTRMDHTLANIHLLRQALADGIEMCLIDDHNSIHLIDRSITLAKEHYHYLSLLPLSLEVTGIQLSGFQYPLDNATLTLGQSLAVSNQWEEEQGTVSIKDGLLLVIRSHD